VARAGEYVAKVDDEQKNPVKLASADNKKLEELDHLIRKVYWRTNLDSALYFAQQQLTEAKRAKLIKWEARALANQGALHYRLGNYDDALASLQQAMPLEQQREEWRKLASLYQRVGNILRKKGAFRRH